MSVGLCTCWCAATIAFRRSQPAPKDLQLETTKRHPAPGAGKTGRPRLIFDRLSNISAMMWFSTEHGFRMSSFKSKIRGKKYALKHATSVEDLERPPTIKEDQQNVRKQNGFSDEAADWEFVNFNPGIFSSNRRNSMMAQAPSSMWSNQPDESQTDGCERSPENGDKDDDKISQQSGSCSSYSPSSNPSSEQNTAAVTRRTKENASHRSRPPSWLIALPRYFISEESLI
ncbi:hypothetical protein U1Q18_051017 [Sarracenia purpurea var. burkii]